MVSTEAAVQRRKTRKKQQTPRQQERDLEPERCKGMDPEVRRQRLRSLKRQKKNLRRDVPVSPDSPWFHARWDHGSQFPPGADETKMRRCRDCERYTPPQCLVDRLEICLECQCERMSDAELEALPSSCSSINLAKMKAAAKFGKSYGGGF